MILILLGIVLVVALGVGLGLFFRAKEGRIPDKHDLAGALDQQVDKLFKQPREHALVVGIYKDERLYSKGYGVTSKDAGIAPDAQTVFQIGSITKVFTASLLQALSDQNVVSLDATLQELIGESVPMTQSVADISLRQMVTHTSGLPRIPKYMLKEIERLAGKSNVMVDPYSYLGVDDMFAYLETAEDAKASGKFAYSNYGMGMLAHVLERVVGESLEDMLQAEIFASLDMTSTGITVTPDMEKRFAQGHDAKGKAAGLWYMKSLGGAGALYSNMDDMLEFVRASLEPGSPANQRFEKMRAPQYGGKTGIGWIQPGIMEKLLGSRNAVWHNGMVGGYSSYISIDPVNRTGVVVLTGRAIDATMLGLTLARQVRTQSWD